MSFDFFHRNTEGSFNRRQKTMFLMETLNYYFNRNIFDMKDFDLERELEKLKDNENAMLYYQNRLEQKTSNLFVYGTLKRGRPTRLSVHCRNSVLQSMGARFIDDAVTKNKYLMYNCGSFPALTENENGIEVIGETWEIDEKIMKRLDGIEGVDGNLYKRVFIDLKQPEIKYVQGYVFGSEPRGLELCGNEWTGD